MASPLLNLSHDHSLEHLGLVDGKGCKVEYLFQWSGMMNNFHHFTFEERRYLGEITQLLATVRKFESL
jgi:hypothetical protein